MPLLDANNDPISDGMMVRMNEDIADHDLVKGVDYVVFDTGGYKSLCLRHPDTGMIFTHRAPRCFYTTNEGGPW